MHPLVSSHIGVKGNVYLGPSDNNGILGDITPFKYIVLNFMSSDVFPYESYHNSMTIVCACLSMIITIKRERERQREIEKEKGRSREPMNSGFFVSTRAQP
jgi:hypothetical protein